MSWHPTLSSIERKTDLPQYRPRPITDTQLCEAALKPIGSGDCWCGHNSIHGRVRTLAHRTRVA